MPGGLPRLTRIGQRWRGDTRLLPGVRRALTGLFAAAVAATIAQWAIRPTHPVLSLAIVPAVAVLVWLAWSTPRRPAPLAYAPAIDVVCLTIVVAAVGPQAALPLLYASVMRRAMDGRTFDTGATIGAHLAALAIGSIVGGVALSAAELPAAVPGLVIAGLALRVAVVASTRHDQSAGARFEAVVQGSPDLLLITRADTTVTYVSPSVLDVLRLEPGRVLGRPLLDLVDEGDRGILEHAVTPSGRRSHTVECQLRRGDGSIVHAEIAVNDMLADPVVAGLVLSVRNITDRATVAHQLRHQAFHDALTKLANRALFLDRLQVALNDDRPHAAIVLLDLDGFKSVNDNFGHEAGDALLSEVAERLRRSVDSADTVARLGGDEFAILLVDGRGNENTALEVAQRIGSAFAEPMQLLGQRLLAQGSIGIAVAAPTTTTSNLLRNADVAMYRAKAAGKNRIEVFHAEMDRDAARKVEAERELREAAVLGQWVAHYQPIVDLATGRVHALEALVRWNHPDRGLLAPHDFLILAEETGVIVEIGGWILGEACRRVAGWQRDAGAGTGLGLHVNVSDRQLRHAGFVEMVRTTLESSGLAPGTLTLETTEQVLTGDQDDVVRGRLLQLRRLGVHVALDDFGTGVSSLGALADYPIDALKIDRSFVAKVTWPEPESSVLARTVIAMGAALGLVVIAEGIETAEEHTELVALGCTVGQGFSIARPLSPGAVEELLFGREPALV